MDTKEIKVMLEEAIEKGVQQRSGTHSDILSQLIDLKKDMKELKVTTDNLKKTIEGWKIGGKVGFGMLLVIGGVTTWVLNTLGIHIGIK